MANTNQENIRDKALQARADFEANRLARPLLAKLYGEYNSTVEDMDTFLDQAATLFPSANCGIASVYLRYVLQAGEIVPAYPKNPGEKLGTYNGHGHTFLLLGSLVVDITADQFGGPDVYVGPLQNPWDISE